MRAGLPLAVDIDLAKFFDTVNHDVLMNLLGRTIPDKPLLALESGATCAPELKPGHKAS